MALLDSPYMKWFFFRASVILSRYLLSIRARISLSLARLSMRAKMALSWESKSSYLKRTV